MGKVLRFPNCREISPEASKQIAQQTKESAYWLRRWSEIYRRLCEVDSEDMSGWAIQDASLYVLGYLNEHNRAVLKARGF